MPPTSSSPRSIPDVIRSYTQGRAVTTHHLQTNLGVMMSLLFAEAAALCDRKQQDYGSDNLIADGLQGVIIRAGDKLARIRNLTKAGQGQAVNDESIADTLLDLCNYAAIGYLMATGLWPDDSKIVLSPRTQPAHPIMQPPTHPLSEAEILQEGAASDPDHEDHGDFLSSQTLREVEDYFNARDPAKVPFIPLSGETYIHTRVPDEVRCHGLVISNSVHELVKGRSVPPTIMVVFEHLTGTARKVFRAESIEWWWDHYTSRVCHVPADSTSA